MPTYDVTDEPVFALGVKTENASFVESSEAMDFAVGGYGFMNAISRQTPYRRGLADIRKQQFDASSNPGEQSLDGYWLRSQQDFTGGAGALFMEPSNDDFQMKRFASSLGVDVWTRGKLTLLKSVSNYLSLTSATSSCVAVNNGDTKYIVSAESGNTIVYWNGPGSGAVGSWTGTPNGNLASTGDGVLVCTTSGIEYLAAPFTGAKTSIATNATTTSCNVWWVKQRLIIADDHHLYERGITGAAINLNTSGKLYSHPLANWRWTSVVETPTSILAAGYSGSKSAIYKFVVDDNTGDLPTLSSAVTAAELPYGEIVTGMYAYLGSFVVLGTNRGVRVAEIDGNGSLIYGPLSFTSTDTSKITGFAGRDRFVYIGVGNELDGNAGLIRIDMSSSNGNGRYAWATDLNSKYPGRVNSVTNYGDLIAFTNTNLYVESATNYVSSGYLTTAQVRYNTLEPKTFRAFRLRGDISTGSVNVSSVVYNGNAVSLFTFDPNVNLAQDIAIVNPASAVESLALKITLNSTGVYTQTPTVTGWQMRAVPASARRILLKVPLMCFDHETDNMGVARGYDGYAYDRLTALQTAATDGSVLVFQDLRTGERLAVTVEDLAFTQEVPNAQSKVDNFGGIIELTVQTV